MTSSEPRASGGEKLFAGMAASACLLLTLRIWSAVAAAQSTWPLPALYFLELVGLGLACAVAYWASSGLRRIITWTTLGVLAAFSVLGAWSIGLYYVPVAAIYLTLGVSDDVRNRGNLAMHAAVAALAALLQAAAALLLAQLS